MKRRLPGLQSAGANPPRATVPSRLLFKDYWSDEGHHQFWEQAAPSGAHVVIVLDLCCDKDHRFEGWFACAGTFEDQQARKLVSCPVCASTVLRRLPSAPYVQTRSVTPPPAGAPSVPTPSSSLAAATVLQRLRHMSRHAENVGEHLPEEARRIHYGETKARDIRGQASTEDVEALRDEGIMVLPLPPPEDDLH